MSFLNRKRTPVTAAGLRKYDHLPPAEAVLKAWNTAGSHPVWDEARKREMREQLPLVARALDRMAKETGEGF